MGGGVLDALADGDAQRTRGIRRLGQHRATVCGQRAGAGHHVGAVHLHEVATAGLGVVRGPDHVDHDLEAEDGACHRERGAPLAGTGLGGQARDALFLVVEGLRDGGVGLVAAGRAATLVLVEDLGRRAQGLLQAMRPEERRGPVHGVGLAHRLRDLDLALRAHLLADQGHGEERQQVIGPDGLLGARVERRRQRHRAGLR